MSFLPPFSSPSCLTFKKVSVVTSPVKISIWNVEVYWSLCLLGSCFPTHRPCLLSSLSLCTSWDWELNRWLYLRHWLSYRNWKDGPSPLLLFIMQSPEKQKSKPVSPQLQNLMKGRIEHPLPIPLSVPAQHTRLQAAPDHQNEHSAPDHRALTIALVSKSLLIPVSISWIQIMLQALTQAPKLSLMQRG